MGRKLSVDLTGQRFGTRIVLGFAGRSKKGGNALWNVRCDCGHEYKCLSQTLRNNKSCSSCNLALKDPRPYRRLRPYEYRYNACKHRARHPMLLTYEEFFEFTKITECHYCGHVIDWGEPFGKDRPSGLNLDRKDSGLPYQLDNVVVSCLRCNYGKNNFFTYNEWLEIGKLIRSWRENAVSEISK